MDNTSTDNSDSITDTGSGSITDVGDRFHSHTGAEPDQGGMKDERLDRRTGCELDPGMPLGEAT